MTEADLVGQVVGKYQVERLLGVGGMGRVYSAVHPILNKRVAIKVLSSEYAQQQQAVARFFNEARAAAALNHANIVEVYDFDYLPSGEPYMLMELLEGEPLSQVLASAGTLSVEAALPILASVCSAVGAAHRAGIIHRDLKPDNIFVVRREGAEGLVKVLDFGTAKLLDQSTAGSVQTRSGLLLGTPDYMSPEQALGENHRVGPASDVYSLGVIAFQLLTGTTPFPSDRLSFQQVLLKHATEAPPPLRELRPDLSLELERVVATALAKEPADRWPSMEALSRALAEAVRPPGTLVDPMPAFAAPSLRAGPDAPTFYPAAVTPAPRGIAHPAGADEKPTTPARGKAAAAPAPVETFPDAVAPASEEMPELTQMRAHRRRILLAGGALGIAAGLGLLALILHGGSSGGSAAATSSPLAPPTARPSPAPSGSSVAPAAAASAPPAQPAPSHAAAPSIPAPSAAPPTPAVASGAPPHTPPGRRAAGDETPVRVPAPTRKPVEQTPGKRSSQSVDLDSPFLQ